MSLVNCRGCGKLQLGSAEVLCSDCLRGRIEQSHRVKSYLREHPQATVMELCAHTGLPLSTIHEMVKRV
ncbi:helix-turn-helix domain-containing protein [Paenibacillus cremeus]|nr:helix-turn-helix domain-containing protein [Paenibacillus cremeus]